MKKLFILLFLFFVVQTNAQIITTFAGNGYGAGSGFGGYSGDGSAATSANLNSPQCLAFDGSGNLYIADYNNHSIRLVNTAGIISTVAGNGSYGYGGDGGPATLANLAHPSSIAFDTLGNLFIGENTRIRKVDVSGIISTFIAGLSYPTGLAFDRAGNLYFCQGNQIIKSTPAGITTVVAGTGGVGNSGDGGPATAAKFNGPSGIAFDGKKNLYVADYWNRRVRKIDTAGIISTFAGTGPGAGGDNGSAIFSQFFPLNIAFDGNCNLYICDADNQKIRVINTINRINTFAGNGTPGYTGDGGSATAATMYGPMGLAFDALGNMYIADSYNNVVRKVTSPGIPSYPLKPLLFQKIYSGLGGNHIIKTSDKGYLLNGFTNYLATENMLLIKTDSLGDTLWSRSYGTGNGLNCTVQPISSGGYLLGGGDGMESTLIKINSAGDTVWTRHYGFAITAGAAAIEAKDGNYLLAGYTNRPSNSGGCNSCFYPMLVKVKPNGDTAWAKCYYGPGGTMNKIIQTFDGGYLLASQMPIGSSGNHAVYLDKVDSLGNLMWARYYNGVTTSSSSANFILQTKDTGYVIAGTTNDFGYSPNTAMFILKLTASGAISWAKTYSGQTNSSSANSVQPTSDNGYIIACQINYDFGNSYSNFCLLKTDNAGNITWAKTYTDSLNGGTATFAIQTADTGFVATGNASFGGTNGTYFLKTDKNGDVDCYEQSTSLTEASAPFNNTAVNFVSTLNMSDNGYVFPIYKNTGIKSQRGVYSNLVCGNIFGNNCLIQIQHSASSKGVTLEEKNIIIYPNPASKQFFISMATNDMVTVNIFDVNGKHVFETQAYTKSYIDVTSLKEGVYSITIKTKDQVINKKLVIVR